MVGVPLSQLPRPTRDRIAALAAAQSDHRPRRARARTVAKGPCEWTCESAGCTEGPFKTWASAERHAHGFGHWRIASGGLSGIVDVGPSAV